MKISIDWLKEYLDVPESPEKLQADLTLSGLVVESITRMGNDVVLEIEVTSNRPDCLSHVGVARELSALYQRPLRFPAARKRLRIPAERIPFSIEIRDPDLCPRYVGIVLDNVRLGPSPDWMQKRLEAAGMRPLNNIVDITNYVLLELGHPLHAFDFAALREGRIVVSRAGEGQKITTLDGIDRQLDSEMLLINDGRGPVAIAGVMGGLHSEISLSTTTVLLECAYFRPSSVRRTSKKLGLSTEASYRFERGADWDGTVPAIARTCQLIAELAGGRIAGSVQDVYPNVIPPVQIDLQRRHAESLLGVSLEDSFIESTLARLNFKLKRKGKSAWIVTCPTYRADMELEADLVEEIARFHGYQNIPTTIPASKSAGVPAPGSFCESAARRILLGMGYCEAVNLSFAAEQEHLEFPPLAGERVAVKNPLTEDTQYMRTTVAAGLVKATRNNFNHDNREVRLFEIGRVYHRGPGGAPVEKKMLGIAGTGSYSGLNWVQSEEVYDFFHIKGMVELLLQGMRCQAPEIAGVAEAPWLNPADGSYVSVGGERIGVVGSLHPDLAEKYKIRQSVYLAELDFETLCSLAFAPVKFEALARFPSVERDLSIVVDAGTSYAEVCSGIGSLGMTELVRINLIDVYTGEKIPAGKVSLTLRFIFQDRERTLTVDRIQGFSDNIFTFLKNSFGAQLR